jgi:1,4-alpha-glucan branching enzyme
MAKRADLRTQLEMDLRRIAEGRHHDPHSLLGPHERDGAAHVLLYIPSARDVKLDGRLDAARLEGTDFFTWSGPRSALAPHYKVSWTDSHGTFLEQACSARTFYLLTV